MKEEKPVVPHVYTAIAEVMATISKEGISKDRSNEQQGYKFRGIDDVYNALAPILADSKLCILPYVKSRAVTERTTQRGGVLFYVTVDVDFSLVSAVDGSSHVISVVGEAMDSGDKATNKAMSAAYKYACMQAFCIPTEGDNDADTTTHQVAPAPKQAAPAPALIGPNELFAIESLAKATGTETSNIAAAYKVATINDLPLAQAQDCITRLQKKAADAKAATAAVTV